MEQNTFRADVEILRAVRKMTFGELKDILCTHYGITTSRVNELMQQCSKRGLVSHNKNLHLYLNVTHKLGVKQDAVKEIMTFYRGLEVEKHPFQPHQYDHELDVDEVISHHTTTVEAVDVVESECDMRSYNDAFDCNTTQNCYLDTVALEDAESDGCEYLDEDNSSLTEDMISSSAVQTCNLCETATIANLNGQQACSGETATITGPHDQQARGDDSVIIAEPNTLQVPDGAQSKDIGLDTLDHQPETLQVPDGAQSEDAGLDTLEHQHVSHRAIDQITIDCVQDGDTHIAIDHKLNCILEDDGDRRVNVVIVDD